MGRLLNKKKSVPKFEGCLTCVVGTFVGIIDGMTEISCYSAKRGLDDRLCYSATYVYLKDGEKYPKDCPRKDEIEKGEK